MTDWSTRCPCSCWLGPDRRRLGCCLRNSCTRLRQRQLVAWPSCYVEIVTRVLIHTQMTHNRWTNLLSTSCWDLLWCFFRSGETFRRIKKPLKNLQLCLKSVRNVLLCHLLLAPALEVLVVSRSLRQTSQDITPRVMIKARRERARAASPKLSPPFSAGGKHQMNLITLCVQGIH